MEIQIEVSLICSHCGVKRSITTDVLSTKAMEVVPYMNTQLIVRYKRHLKEECKGKK